MTALTATPIDPEFAVQLSDAELEEELTLAALTTAREQQYELLLSERRQRRQHSGTLEPWGTASSLPRAR